MKPVKVSALLTLMALALQLSAQEKTEEIYGSVLGFNILEQITGLWNGPVTSTTPAGSFPAWYVDFRPVSPGQISQYSNLDSLTVNNISFFIVQHGKQFKVAMRTEGCFANKCCVTYEVADSVDEEKGYYRFSDFVKGQERAYTEFIFSENGFVMEVYTSKFNKENPPVLHTRWETTRGDSKAATPAVKKFKFPQPAVIKDFSKVFDGMEESIFFDFSKDPYASEMQPYAGGAKFSVSYGGGLKAKKDHELFVLLTTESLFEGLKLKENFHDYYSRYFLMPGGTKTCTLKNIHPGKYYVYVFADTNGDKLHLSGDYMSSRTDYTITVTEDGTLDADTMIDMVIP
ncbi:MAG: hypothetical protein ABIJ16_10710 [Bacteroidota bacterium]